MNRRMTSMPYNNKRDRLEVMIADIDADIANVDSIIELVRSGGWNREAIPFAQKRLGTYESIMERYPKYEAEFKNLDRGSALEQVAQEVDSQLTIFSFEQQYHTRYRLSDTTLRLLVDDLRALLADVQDARTAPVVPGQTPPDPIAQARAFRARLDGILTNRFKRLSS